MKVNYHLRAHYFDNLDGCLLTRDRASHAETRAVFRIGSFRDPLTTRERESELHLRALQSSAAAAMDLLPGEGGGTPSIARRQGFRSLKLVNFAMDEPLPTEPVGVEYGVLENGLSYYVRSNPKPRMRAALALAVKVG